MIRPPFTIHASTTRFGLREALHVGTVTTAGVAGRSASLLDPRPLQRLAVEGCWQVFGGSSQLVSG